MKKEPLPPLSKREKLAVYVLLFLVRILAPWDYESQYKEVISAIETTLKEQQ